MSDEPQDPKTFTNFKDDTPRITPTDLDQLIKDHSNFSSITIIDCRSEIEYNGGHIKGAMNISSWNDKERIASLYREIWQPKSLYVFHCEFSLFRGPAAWRSFSGEHSKSANKGLPLHGFVLNGGYREFHAKYPEQCDGGYVSEAKAVLAQMKIRAE